MDRRISSVALLAAVSLAACSPDLAAPIMAPNAPNLSKSVGQAGKHIVALKGGQTQQTFTTRVNALGGSVSFYHAGSGIAVVKGLGSAGAADLAASGVGQVEADSYFSIDLHSAPTRPDASEVAAADINSVENPASAGRFPYQWNMRSIDAPAAWTAGKLGSSNVTVAILDTGIDYDLPDMNGLVDLARSTSFMDEFVGQLDNPATPENEYDPIVPSDDAIVGFFPGRHLVTDLNGHGTNVATQVSSKAFRLAGVTSKTTLIGVKVLGANGSGSLSSVLSGVLHAADNGADVANMSLGGGFAKSGNGYIVGLINRVFNYARQKGMLVVVSAGNSGINLQHNENVFASYCDAPHVICVSSVGPTTGMFTPDTPFATSDPDAPAYYTNFGMNSVDIAAPGGNADAANKFAPSVWPWTRPAPLPFTGNDVASWVWSYCAKHSLIIQPDAVDPKVGDLFLTTCFNSLLLNGYIGTSQAAPHVAGLAALLVAENGKGKPDAIKRQIIRSSDPINPAVGRGRINVKRALGL